MSITEPVDLEDLATGYEHRPSSDAAIARATRAATDVGLGPGDIAVDVGGGRGRHAAAWVPTGAGVVVVDPARGMVGRAAALPGVRPICGVAQALPLRDGIAALVYFHLSLHYGDWRRSLDEAARVLRPGGVCWIWTMGAEHHRRSFLARWFPSVGDIDVARFPDPARVVAALDAAGLDVTRGREVEPKILPASRWRAAVEARFVSTLQLVPTAELVAGLARFDETYPDGDQLIDYELTFDWIRARA